MFFVRSGAPAGPGRVGARLLPAVQEPQGRLRQGLLQRHQLGQRGHPLGHGQKRGGPLTPAGQTLAT